MDFLDAETLVVQLSNNGVDLPPMVFTGETINDCIETFHAVLVEARCTGSEIGFNKATLILAGMNVNQPKTA